MRFHVTYSYCASGMEGRRDEKDYGIIEAETADEAREKVVTDEYPADVMYGPNNTYSSREFLRGCVRAS